MSYSNLVTGPFAFWEGFGRIADIGGTFVEFNSSLTGQQADRSALRSDWSAVGGDLWAALLEARKQLGTSGEQK